jgi:hypothetical protein
VVVARVVAGRVVSSPRVIDRIVRGIALSEGVVWITFTLPSLVFVNAWSTFPSRPAM